MDRDAKSDMIHGSCVAWENSAVLITGKAGTGKSALCLQLMALGAELVADDRVVVTVREGGLWASPAPNIAGLIEARGVGILRANNTAGAWVRLMVDLNEDEEERLPPRRHAALLGVDLDVVHKVARAYFPAALMQYIKGGRYE